MRGKQVSYHPACNTLDPSERLTPTRMASKRCGTPFTMISVIIHWPWHFSFWPAHPGTAPSTHPLKHYLPSSHSLWYQVTALRSAPTTSSACLFSAQPKYQRFLQGRAEGAVPTGSFTPPWGHCSLPLCIKKPQLCQHHQVGAELKSLSGTGKKRSYLLTPHNERENHHHQAPSVQQPESTRLALTRSAAEKQEHSRERVAVTSNMIPYPCPWIMWSPSLLPLSSTCVYRKAVLISA